MKLVTYKNENTTDLGILINDNIYSLHHIDATLPNNMRAFLFAGAEAMSKAKQHDADLRKGTRLVVRIEIAEVASPKASPEVMTSEPADRVVMPV